jgi:O-antigen ligase
MATMSIGAALLIGAIVFTSSNFRELWEGIKAEWAKSPSRKYIWISFALAIFCILSLIGGKLYPVSYGGRGVQVHFWKDVAKIWYLFWPVLLVVGLRRLSENSRSFVFHAWLGAFGVLSTIGIIQFFTGWPRLQMIPGEIIHYHATLFLGHHLSVASILIFPFFAALDSTFHSPFRRFYLYVGLTVLGVATLFFTYSRTLWIALPIGIFIWVLTRIQKWSHRGWVLAMVLIGLLAASQYEPIQRRLRDDLGVGQRQELWLANLEFLKERPFLGVGWRHNQELSGYYFMNKYNSTDVFSGHAHNNFLEMLGGIGTLGTLSWVAWNLCIFWLLFNKRKKPDSLNFSHGLLCAWIVFHLNGLTQVNFWDAKVQHQIAWVVAWALL